jgi:N-acetylglucosaminyldiphosphoundecaprenol N-acetyl-beta-D-mannosaminyltransferase
MTNRVNVLGVGISVLNLRTALAAIADAVRAAQRLHLRDRRPRRDGGAGDAAFKKILNGAFLCTPDGMPMVWAGKLNGHREMSRVYGPDLMLDVCAWSETSGCRHFFYGGADGVAELLAQKLKGEISQTGSRRHFHAAVPPLNADEEKQLQEQIRAAQPDILWVGLSTPKQEKFMAEFLPKLDVTLMIGVGAAFDFHSGRVRQAPRWMQRSGLEWFYRLCSEPRRLAKRYLRNNPLFVLKFFGQLTG